VDPVTLEKIEFDAVRHILAAYCRCRLGARVACNIGPTQKVDVACRWLEQTTQMIQAIGSAGLPPVGGVADIEDPLSRAAPGGHPTGEDMAAIASTLDALRLIKQYLMALPDSLPLPRALADGIADFGDDIDAIRAVVASDGSILDDASDRLRRLRKDIADIERRIHDEIHSYLHRDDVRRLLQQQTVTLHDDRYVLPVRADNRGRLPGVVHRTSGSGATVFVEPTACVELNNHLADLRDDERTEILRLLNELAMRIAPRRDEIEAALRAGAQVDLAAAKAQYANEYDMVAPTLSEDGPLEFPHARHPLLLDQAKRRRRARADSAPVEEVVPIDVRLGSDFDVLVITGSNTGGKTVALKTVALLATMAQCGLYVPARTGATMPVFRDVLIDVGDEQSLEQSLSTFGGHIHRLRHILERASSRTLVLLDELGAGTDPDEGAAIGQAVLDELRRKKCLAMVTTHLSVLKAYAFNHDRVDNASVEFDTESLRPTYHLHIGTPGESHAIVVADRLGLGPRLIEGARRHLTEQGQQFSRAIRASGQARRQAEVARADARQAEEDARQQAEDLDRRMGELEQVRGDFQTWLANLPSLKPGDELFVPSLNRTAKLVRLELHKQQVVVDTGAMHVEVSLRDLMPDFGQDAIRAEIEKAQQEIRQQLRHSQQATERAQQSETRFRRRLAALRRRRERMTRWLEKVRGLRVGDEVTLARPPGKGTLVQASLERLTVTVRADKQDMVLPIAELFPEMRRGEPDKAPAEPEKRAKPMRRRSAKPTPSRRRQKLLTAKPGSDVFVVPFDRRGKLVRLDEDKEVAVVLVGNFEVQVPLADLQPPRPGPGRSG